MDTKGLQKEFISWCKSKNKSPKTKEEAQQLFVSFMKEKHPEEYKKAVESQLQQQAQQAQKALHGAKLQYFKKLKNQCAEDEEVVYYKKGGSVNCGCKKKENGGEVKKDCGGSAIVKFKKMKSGKKITIKQQPQVNPSDTVHVNGIAYSVTNSNGSPVDNRFKPYSGKVEEEDRKKAKKGDKDALKRQLKQDLASSEKCGGKVKKHQDGSVISQFKMHRLGGSLNGIPFYLEGTNEGGIKKEIKLPEYMAKLLIGYPSILPGRYTGLERLTPGVFRMFKTWVKGLPKTLTPADYISVGAGAAGGIGLGYDDTHDLYVRKWITNTEKSLLLPPLTPSKPFIEFIKINKPKFKK